MTKSSGAQSPELKTVARAVEVLKAFASADEWTVSALARELGMPKSVTHRLLATLAGGGLLVKDARSDRYALSLLVSTLARRAERRTSLTHLARPFLIELADDSQETVSLCVLNGNTGLCLDTIDSPQSMRFTVSVGEAFFLNAGAAGKALLAFQAPAYIDRALAVSPLPRYTDSTITSPTVLREELETIRRTGFAYSDSEITPGARSIGAPVWNHDGRVVGALVISAPAFRLEASDRTRLEGRLIVTVESVSTALGFGGPYPWSRREERSHAAQP